jgi:hypothetical protein
MTAKQCFMNATLRALEDPSLTYVEGIAAWLIPFDHAWLVDRDGFVVDPTLKPRDRAGEVSYFGVPFTREYLLERTKRTRYYGLMGMMSADRELFEGKRADAVARVQGAADAG